MAGSSWSDIEKKIQQGIKDAASGKTIADAIEGTIAHKSTPPKPAAKSTSSTWFPGMPTKSSSSSSVASKSSSSAGGAGGSGAPEHPTSPSQVSDSMLAKDFPSYQWAFAIPEIKALFKKIASSPTAVPADQVSSQLQATQWWKTHSGTARAYYQMEHQDPAKYKQELSTRQDYIQQMAGKFGVALDSKTAASYARSALYSNWSDPEIEKNLAAQFKYTGAETGNAGVLESNIKNLAAQYMLPMSNGTMQSWVQQAIKNNDWQAEQFTNQMKEQAKSLFPTLGDAIDKGVTVAQYVEPYRQLAAKDLEISPESVDFMDPKWNKALNTIDPQTNERRPMSLSDFQTMYKTDNTYGYDKTQGARDQAAQITSQLGSMMGVMK